MTTLARPLTFGILTLAFSACSGAGAQERDESPRIEEEEALTAEEQRAAEQWATAFDAMVRGPDSVALIEQGKLDLPEGFGFVPKAEATTLMQLMGNQVDDRFIGLVFPLGDEQSYFVSLSYEPSGYIKDDEAADWDADALLQGLKDGTEAANAERRRMGFEALTVTRWVEPPAYDAAVHRLVWSAEAVVKNRPDPDPTINYNTYVLGREGYLSANLITAASSVSNDRLSAASLLGAVAFNDGKRYQDFNSSTDKIAAYGLTALVGGIAAKKLGLIAVITAFVAKFAKVIIVGLVAFGGTARAFFARRKQA
jgi:uncharacterized membrane-anchored protein